MIRLTLIGLVLFCLPFAIYFVYRGLLLRLKIESRGRFDERPMQALILAGGALTLAGLAVFAFTSGERGDTVYIPAHIEDGQVVRGRFVPADEAGDLARIDPKERANPRPSDVSGVGDNTP